MPDKVYKIRIEGLEGIRLDDTVTQPSGEATVSKVKPRQGRVKAEPKAEKSELFTTAEKGVATGLLIGREVVGYTKETAQMRGNSAKIAGITNVEKIANIGLTVGLGFKAAGPVGAAIAIGYTSYNLARENRVFIHEIQNDTARADYYTQRIIRERTGRSR
jgi:hypothetical protein